MQNQMRATIDRGLGDLQSKQGQGGLPVPPQGSTMLIESTEGALVVVAPREGFEDVVTAFELVGEERIGTNWPVRPSFPVFVLNAIGYLGGNREVAQAGTVKPGRPIALRPETDAREISILPPDGETAINVARDKGILAVEMEAAALYTFARAAGARVLCLAHVTNTMGQTGDDFEKGEADGTTDALGVLRTIIDACHAWAF